MQEHTRLQQRDRSKELKMNLKEKLIEMVAQNLGIDQMDIQMESNFLNDLGADSLDTVELVLELEDEFGIDIPDDQAEKLLTVGDVYSYLDNVVDDRYIR
jgi:acyl carrier protein